MGPNPIKKTKKVLKINVLGAFKALPCSHIKNETISFHLNSISFNMKIRSDLYEWLFEYAFLLLEKA